VNVTFGQAIPIAMVMVTSLALILSPRWRWTIIALAVQYAAVFWLVSMTWSIGLSVVKLVAGWMAGAVLATTQSESGTGDDPYDSRSGRVFQAMAAVMVWLVVFASGSVVSQWIPANGAQIYGALVLVGMGLLHLGLSTRPIRVVLGLLTVISGFEVLYAAVEISILVAGLLAALNLGLSLVGAYLILSPTMGESA